MTHKIVYLFPFYNKKSSNKLKCDPHEMAENNFYTAPGNLSKLSVDVQAVCADLAQLFTTTSAVECIFLDATSKYIYFVIFFSASNFYLKYFKKAH